MLGVGGWGLGICQTPIPNPQKMPQMLLWKKCLLLFCLLPVWGCGYHWVGKETHLPSGVTSIAIPTFINKTLEPGIEIPFTQAFLREFILDRRVKVVDRKEADSILEGIIIYYTFSVVSFDKSGLALEYQTNVIIDLTLKEPNGKILWRENNFSETTWYRTSSNVLTNEANKNAGLQETGRLMAGRIRNRFFYNF
jgi:outer membrane lipopolysaccharide assembly protein LptE/RlpB